MKPTAIVGKSKRHHSVGGIVAVSTRGNLRTAFQAFLASLRGSPVALNISLAGVAFTAKAEQRHLICGCHVSPEESSVDGYSVEIKPYTGGAGLILR